MGYDLLRFHSAYRNSGGIITLCENNVRIEYRPHSDSLEDQELQYFS